MKVVIHQPSYLPWVGLFDRVAQADCYVILDDVQYDKHGWRNRNRIKGPQGPQWLTVPVLTKGRGLVPCSKALVNPRIAWAKKHRQAIRSNYGRAPFFDRYFPAIEALLTRPWQRLIDLDVAASDWLFEVLGQPVKRLYSSSLQIQAPTASDRLAVICQRLGATEYIAPDMSKGYLDTAVFDAIGIRVRFHGYVHPVYPQLYGPFVPYLSILDLLFNCGDASLSILTHRAQHVQTS